MQVTTFSLHTDVDGNCIRSLELKYKKIIKNRHGGGISVYYNENDKIELCSEGTVVF